MQADSGIPIAFMPLVIGVDGERLRLEQMARTGLEPRIPDIHIRWFCACCPRPPQLRLPHRVIFKGRNRFWARSSGGKYEPNVDELRTLFTFAPQLAERMREFRIDRIARIAASDAPVPLSVSVALCFTLFHFRVSTIHHSCLKQRSITVWIFGRSVEITSIATE